jgi:hypothetical protein
MSYIRNTKQTQKALDDEMRARIDPLLLKPIPMRLSDMARLPKGIKFEIRWGKHRTVLSTIKYFILVMFYKTLRLIPSTTRLKILNVLETNG